MYFEAVSFKDFFSLTNIYKTIPEKKFILELFNWVKIPGAYL